MNTPLSNADVNAINKIISDQLDISPDQIIPEAHLVNDLGADSLDIAEMSMTLEDAFDISIPDESSDRMLIVATLYETIAEFKYGLKSR